MMATLRAITSSKVGRTKGTLADDDVTLEDCEMPMVGVVVTGDDFLHFGWVPKE